MMEMLRSEVQHTTVQRSIPADLKLAGHTPGRASFFGVCTNSCANDIVCGRGYSCDNGLCRCDALACQGKGEGKRCVAACTDDRGCPDGYACKAVASSSTSVATCRLTVEGSACTSSAPNGT